MVKNRVLYLDTICGILILHMIYTCHLPLFVDNTECQSWLLFKIPSMFFGFFMGWFFFKSGMFYKEKPIRDVIKASNQRLLLPFIFFTIIGSILQVVFGFYNHTYTSILKLIASPIAETIKCESPGFSLANWFLLSLYVVRIVYVILQRIGIRPIIIFFCSIILAYIVYYICYIKEPVLFVIASKKIYLPFYLGNMFYGLAFYSLGHLLKTIQFNKILFVTSLLVYIVHFFYISGIDVRQDYAEGAYPSYLLAVIYSLAGIIVINNIFKIFISRKIPLLTYIGKNSMIYYVTHYTTLCVLVGLIQNIKDEIDKPLLYIMLAIILTILLIIYDRIFTRTKFKRILGAK